MAALFCESFDYLATADLAERFTTTQGEVDSTIGRRSSGGWRSGFGNAGFTKVVSASGATAIVGMAYQPNAMTGGRCIRIYQGGSVQASLTLTSGGALAAYRGDGSTLLGTSAVGAVETAAYNYIEFKVLIHSSTGTVDVRINGSSVLSLTGQNTQATASATWDQFGLSAQNANSYIDDIYVLDGSGADNNDFLGDIRVDCHYPTSEGTTIGWTPLSGTDNALMVDDATSPDDDTTYNETTTVNAIDSFNCTDLVATGASIKFVEVVINAKKTDAGTAEIAPLIRYSGTDYSGTAQALSTSYVYYSQVYEENPGTSAAWTETDFEASEFGYKKTT